MDINKIIELDADSQREPYLQIRYIVRTERPRSRQPSEEQNLIHDMMVMIEALGSLIIESEKTGVCKKGEAMSKAIEHLNSFYIESDIESNVSPLREEAVTYRTTEDRNRLEKK